MLTRVGFFWLSVAVAAGLALAWFGATLVLRVLRRRSSRPSETGALMGMKVREFESLVRESFKLQGYQVIEGRRGAAEGGELALRRDRETVLVQCRHWRDRKVGVGAVQALQSAMAARGAGGGFVLTAGRFSREAAAFAAGSNVRLVDGDGLIGLIERASGAAGSPH